MRVQRILALVLSVGSVPLLAACGGSGTGGGNFQSPGLGVITLVSFAPNPILGCDPVPFTITGTDFQTVTGTTARITWRALGGQTPFAHGTTDRVTTLANVTSNTTIDGLTPNALLCGVPNVLVEIDVALESGVTASSTGIFQVQINAPTITAINPNPLPAAIATPFSITGTGFPAAGGPVTIRFTGDLGALLFNDGTHNYVDIQGVVTSTTNINATSPIATVCGLNAVTLAQLGASIQLFFPDGCCTLPTAAGFVNFLAPAITTLVPNSVPAELPPANLVLNGFNFGPPNTIATVRFIGDANVALFNDGTLNTIDVPGLIGPTTFPAAQTITLISPTAAVCGVASRTAAIRVISPFGSSCRQSTPVFVTFTAPVITTVNNLAQAIVPAHIPTSITIQGTGFGPASGLCAVTFISDPVAPGIFGDGTQIESAPVQGVINAAGTQITVTTPNATVENAVSRFASIRVKFQGDSCASSGPQVVQFTAATLTAMAATAPTAGTFFAAVPTSFLLTGQNFGPVGSEVFVRFVADNGATPFGNGTQNAFEIPGRITAGGPGAGTITGVAPLAALCPALTLGATVRVLFQDGGQSSNSVPLTFTAPSIVFAPLSFPGSVTNVFTITGTGFGPANSLVAVKFTATGNLTPFADGTLNEVTVTGTVNGAATQITGITPLAALCGVASITATVSTTFQGGACASTAVGAVTITAPTINANGFAPATVPAAIPTAFTITGTGYGVNGQPAQVTFSVNPPALPFNNASASEVTVSGTVGGGGTTITGFTPGVAACPNNVVADVRVTLQNGACTGPLSPGVTFLAPTITTNSLTLPLVSLQNPGLMTITGTNFGPINGQATVRWTANSPIFADGTNTAHDAPGTITSATTITTNLPVGRLCLANATATVRAILPMGACADSPANFVTWTAPVITTTTPATTTAYAPAAISITGTTFPVVGTPVAVTFSNAGQVFNNGTSTSETVLGVVNPANTITVTPPAAITCANVVAAISVQFGASNGVAGGCAQAAPSVTLNVPATFAIAPASTPSLAPGLLSVTGANFPAVGSPVQVRLVATAPAGAAPFAAGTQSTVTIGGTVTAVNTVAFTPPVCCINVNTTVSVGLTFQNANCEFAAGSFTLNAPTTTGVNPVTQAELAPTANQTITGTNFPAVGTPVQVTYTGGGAVWVAGTSGQATASGSVTAANVITVPFPPTAQSCVNFNATLTISWSAVNASGCPLVVGTTVAYNAPAVTTVAPTNLAGLGTSPATPLVFTGTNFPAVGTTATVTFVAPAGTTPFGGGTLSQVTVFGSVNPANTVTVAEPMACAAANIAATTVLTFTNAPCQFAGPTFTFNAPTVTSITPATSLDAVAPAAITINGTNFQPNATVDVRFTAAAGTPFNGGNATVVSVPATVNAAGTAIGPFTPPTATLCGAATVVATPTITFPSATCSLVSGVTVTYNAPAITTVTAPAGASFPAFYRGATTMTITGATTVPVGTPVIVRYTSTAAAPNDRPFGDGTLASIDVPGTISAANTVSVSVSPQATICGAATAAGTVRVLFPNGSCSPTSVVTFNAAQFAATTGVAGFQPQNLSYDGNTPFTVFATAGVSDFSNIVGQNVDVVFQNASPIFRGGTATFDIVSGVVATATTITGSAPNIVLAANESSALTIVVRFEDGSCTNNHTSAQYFRADTLLAVGGSGGLNLISTNAGNPYGTGANAVVAGSPIAGASVGGAGGVVVDPTLNRAFSVNGTNLVSVDLAGPAATSPAGTPALTGTTLVNIPLGAAGLGVALDAGTHRVYVLTAGAVTVVNARTNAVILTRTFQAGVVPTGALLNDWARSTLLIPSNVGVAGQGFWRYDTTSDTISGFSAVANIGGAVWTGGAAVGPSAGRVYLTFNDPVAVNVDQTRALAASDLSTILWTTLKAAGADPTAVVGVDETTDNFFYGVGPANGAVVFRDTASTGVANLTIAVGVPVAAIVGPGPISARIYMSTPGAGTVTVANSATTGIVATIAGVAGASAEFVSAP